MEDYGEHLYSWAVSLVATFLCHTCQHWITEWTLQGLFLYSRFDCMVCFRWVHYGIWWQHLIIHRYKRQQKAVGFVCLVKGTYIYIANCQIMFNLTFIYVLVTACFYCCTNSLLNSLQVSFSKTSWHVWFEITMKIHSILLHFSFDWSLFYSHEVEFLQMLLTTSGYIYIQEYFLKKVSIIQSIWENFDLILMAVF